MSDISYSKTCPPRLQQVFPRERLHARLDRCLERPLVWVVGPGGAGKSTLVAHYLELRNLPPIWYRVDRCDADCSTLFHFLGKMIGASETDESPLPVLEQRSAGTARVRSWFREFFRRIPPRTVMVFDDIDVAGAVSEFHTFLACCIEELPPNNRLIAISRDPVPPPLAGFRALGMLSELVWDDLRVTHEEAVGIAGILLDDQVDEHSITHLHTRTNGWMAGLLLCLRHGIPSSELLLSPPSGSPVPETSHRPLSIHTLGRFELYREGVPVTFTGKAPKKPLEMLKVLLAHGGKSVPTGVIIEALWPDVTGAAAVDSLTTTLQRLRHLLGSEKVIAVQHGEVSLDRRQVWVDAWAFEALLKTARESLSLWGTKSR